MTDVVGLHEQEVEKRFKSEGTITRDMLTRLMTMFCVTHEGKLAWIHNDRTTIGDIDLELEEYLSDYLSPEDRANYHRMNIEDKL